MVYTLNGLAGNTASIDINLWGAEINNRPPTWGNKHEELTQKLHHLVSEDMKKHSTPLKQKDLNFLMSMARETVKP